MQPNLVPIGYVRSTPPTTEKCFFNDFSANPHPRQRNSLDNGNSFVLFRIHC